VTKRCIDGLFGIGLYYSTPESEAVENFLKLKEADTGLVMDSRPGRDELKDEDKAIYEYEEWILGGLGPGSLKDWIGSE